jgi:hypothetical protein
MLPSTNVVMRLPSFEISGRSPVLILSARFDL